MRHAPRIGRYARSEADRAGDPLDGLVNLFDLSLVLAVGFLVAALSAIGATDLLKSGGLDTAVQNQKTTVLPGAPPVEGKKVDGEGTSVGSVYKLRDGRFVYVPSAGATAPTASSPTDTTSTTPAPGATPAPTNPTPNSSTGSAPGLPQPNSPGGPLPGGAGGSGIP